MVVRRAQVCLPILRKKNPLVNLYKQADEMTKFMAITTWGRHHVAENPGQTLEAAVAPLIGRGCLGRCIILASVADLALND